MQTPELCYLPLTEVAGDIAARRRSPVEVTETILKRIAAIDSRLNSYVTVTADSAMAQARRAEKEIGAGKYRGPLHGVPIAVKDLCFTKDIPTSGGTLIHAAFRPSFNATVVQRLEDAGAILLGKLNMTEGAGYAHHPQLPRPVNPWGVNLWTGVSSSGSGVATAAGLCYASVGSDTAGSIRFPAACNGLTGLKPTWGRVSRFGILDFAPSYDTLGPMARCAADVAAMFSTIAGHDPHDATSSSEPTSDYVEHLSRTFDARGFTIGIDSNYNSAGTDPSTVRLVDDATAKLQALGAEIRPIVFPDPTELFAHLFDLLLVELAQTHERTYPAQADRYGDWLRAAIEQGRSAQPLDLAKATIARSKYQGRLSHVFTEVDAILTPVLGQGTPTWDKANDLTDLNGFVRFTLPLNATGSPTVTLPCGFTKDRGPVGFQLVGAHYAESSLLRLAHAYQQATHWHVRHPEL